MNARHAIQDIQLSLFRMKVEKGELLKDILLAEMAPEYRAGLRDDATHIHHRTRLQVRKVRRGGKRVWRFIDKI